MVVTCTPTNYRKSHLKKLRTKIKASVCVVHKQDTIFDAVENQLRYRENPLTLGDACLTALSKHVR